MSGRKRRRGSAAGESWEPPARLGLLLLLLSIGGWVLFRMVPAWGPVFPGDGRTHLLGYDSFYHARHGLAVAQNFPHVARWDVGTHYPTGQAGVNQGGHDLFLAILALPFGGDLDAVLLTGAWSSMVNSVIAFGLLYLLGVRLGGAVWAGGLAAWLLLWYPGHTRTYFIFGNCDHHHTEVVLTLASMLGFTYLLTETRGWASYFKWSLLAATPMAFFSVTWFGAPLHLALVGLGFGLATAVFAMRGEAQRVVPQAQALALTTFALIAFLWAVAPSYRINPDTLKLATIWTLAMLALPGPAWIFLKAYEKRKLPHLAVALLALGALGLYLFSKTPQGAHLLGPATEAIAEHQVITLGLFWHLMGPLALLLPLAWLRQLQQAWQGHRSPAAVVAGGYGMLLVAVWCVTRDFSYYTPFVAALMVATELSYFKIPKKAFWIGLGALALLPWMQVGVAEPVLKRAAILDRLYLGDEDIYAATDWLRENTPEPGVPTYAVVPIPEDGNFSYPEDTYGVMCDWTMGHKVALLGNRPVNFSQTLSPYWAKIFINPSEEAVVEAARNLKEDQEGFRYLFLAAKDVANDFAGRVMQADMDPGPYFSEMVESKWESGKVKFRRLGPEYRQVFLTRLYTESGQGPERLRLVYETPGVRVFADHLTINTTTGRVDSKKVAARVNPAQVPNLDQDTLAPTPVGVLFKPSLIPSAKIWEFVPGATIQGTLEPDKTYSLILPLVVESSGRTKSYQRSVITDSQGRFSVVVPYPTEPFPHSAVQPTGPYQIGPLSIAVSEEQVQAGEVVEAS